MRLMMRKRTSRCSHVQFGPGTKFESVGMGAKGRVPTSVRHRLVTGSTGSNYCTAIRTRTEELHCTSTIESILQLSTGYTSSAHYTILITFASLGLNYPSSAHQLHTRPIYLNRSRSLAVDHRSTLGNTYRVR